MKSLAVLIPVYNDATALETTLSSIVEEDNSFTVFIVDDGSREPVVLDPDAYPFAIRVLRQEPNGGIVRALNRGLETIRSEGFDFVARLDAADLNRPGRLGRQYERLADAPDISLIGSNAVFRDEATGEALFTTNLPLDTKGARKWIVFRNCFIHPTVMFRIDILDRIGLYGEDYPHIEDYVFFSRILEHFGSENIEEPLVDCVVRRGGISLKNKKAQLISGLRFRLRHPRPLDPLWYAFLAKRTSYLLIPLSLQARLKMALGFTRPALPAHGPSPARSQKELAATEPPPAWD